MIQLDRRCRLRKIQILSHQFLIGNLYTNQYVHIPVWNPCFEVGFCIFIQLSLPFSATKIEFYVGDVPEGTPPSLQHARYTRLGWEICICSKEKNDTVAVVRLQRLQRVRLAEHLATASRYFSTKIIHRNYANVKELDLPFF